MWPTCSSRRPSRASAAQPSSTRMAAGRYRLRHRHPAGDPRLPLTQEHKLGPEPRPRADRPSRGHCPSEVRPAPTRRRIRHTGHNLPGASPRRPPQSRAAPVVPAPTRPAPRRPGRPRQPQPASVRARLGFARRRLVRTETSWRRNLSTEAHALRHISGLLRTAPAAQPRTLSSTGTEDPGTSPREAAH